mgnify:CR=1 FL=1
MSSVLLSAYYSGGTSTGGPLDINGTTNNGTAFDIAKLNGIAEAAAIVTIGAIGAATTTFKLQHSDDNSTWADVTGGTYSTLPTTTSANKQYMFHVRTGGGCKRYLRIVTTAGAASTLYGVVWIGIRGANGVNGADETARSIAQNLGNGSNLGRLVVAP